MSMCTCRVHYMIMCTCRVHYMIIYTCRVHYMSMCTCRVHYMIKILSFIHRLTHYSAPYTFMIPLILTMCSLYLFVGSPRVMRMV